MEAVLSSVHAISTAIVDAFNDVVEAIRCLGEDLTEACSQLAVNGGLSSLTEYLMEEGWDCVPPRVRHLAFHHPKRRVRNKNWNRMWKIRERCMK